MINTYISNTESNLCCILHKARSSMYTTKKDVDNIRPCRAPL